MPRLLIFCEYPTLLGGERSMLAALPAIAEAGFDVRVAAPLEGQLGNTLLARGIQAVDWRLVHQQGQCRSRRPLASLRADVTKIIRETLPGLVHANSLSTARILGPVSRDCGVPSMGYLRDIVKLTHQAVDDLNANRRLVAVSQATRDFHVAQGLDVSKCAVVYNGVDLCEFHPRKASRYMHRELSLPPTARLIATIGQLGLRKGTDVALLAARQVVEEVQDVHWLLVGQRTSTKNESQEFEAMLYSMAAERPLTGRVHFLGHRDDIPSLLTECMLLVHAARQEPLGRVLLEAAASGVPVVATDVGGTQEIFPSVANGAVLVPPDHSSALAEAVIGLLHNEPYRQELAAAARHRAERAFNIQTAAARLIEQYQSILT